MCVGFYIKIAVYCASYAVITFCLDMTTQYVKRIMSSYIRSKHGRQAKKRDCSQAKKRDYSH